MNGPEGLGQVQARLASHGGQDGVGALLMDEGLRAIVKANDGNLGCQGHPCSWHLRRYSDTSYTEEQYNILN